MNSLDPLIIHFSSFNGKTCVPLCEFYKFTITSKPSLGFANIRKLNETKIDTMSALHVTFCATVMKTRPHWPSALQVTDVQLVVRLLQGPSPSTWVTSTFPFPFKYTAIVYYTGTDQTVWLWFCSSIIYQTPTCRHDINGTFESLSEFTRGFHLKVALYSPRILPFICLPFDIELTNSCSVFTLQINDIFFEFE